MMVVAAQVAAKSGLTEGYRVVLNHGKDAFQTIPNLYLHIIGG
jgi:diadenosine tetraphosphate (Ap4A) HIT family hydrolase